MSPSIQHQHAIHCAQQCATAPKENTACMLPVSANALANIIMARTHMTTLNKLTHGRFLQISLIYHKSCLDKEVYWPNIIHFDTGDKKMFSPGEALTPPKRGASVMAIVRSIQAII